MANRTVLADCSMIQSRSHSSANCRIGEEPMNVHYRRRLQPVADGLIIKLDLLRRGTRGALHAEVPVVDEVVERVRVRRPANITDEPQAGRSSPAPLSASR
jgi:hypothetical protein